MNSKIAVGLVVLIILALVGYAGYRVVRSVQPRNVTITPTVNLLDHTGNNATVRLTIEGPVTANEKHGSTVISVSNNLRAVQALQTYEDALQASQDYPNNQPAFEDFLHALDDAGFTKRNKTTNDNEVGACPTGQRYTYELIDDNRTIMRLWSSSCGGQGTLASNGSSIRQLFQAQIPDYIQFTRTAAVQ